ncbi:hypothetical protein ACJIZ3_017893 [Penstemon smallii]|uniref:Uncharacterized protein n=1 Tax=Penstemon smallii TaxID=265156 RepID=A0ABD3SXN3_9LAMI
MVINMQEYIESDECVRVCGITRNSVGISSDALLETQFTTMLCSSQCYDKCPNIIDLYYNLALAEGVILADLCKPQRTSSRRSVIQLRSLGAAFGSMFVSAIAPASSRSASSVDSAPAPM